MSVTIIEVCTHFQSFTSSEWCQIILHPSLRGLCADPWYTADKLHCEVLILLISKGKHWQDCVHKSCTAPIRFVQWISKGFKPQHYIYITIHLALFSRPWNTTKNAPRIQDFGSWTQSSYTAEVRLALRNSMKKYKISNRGGALGVFFHLVA